MLARDNLIPKERLIGAIYEKLIKRSYPIIDVEFQCVLDDYNDGVESGHLFMTSDRAVVIGKLLLFMNRRYRAKRYAEPIIGFLLAVSSDELGVFPPKPIKLGYHSKGLVKVLVEPIACKRLIISPVGLYDKDMIRLIDIINSNDYFSDAQIEQITSTIAGFCERYPTPL